MRGLRLKRAPGGQQCRRAALALLPLDALLGVVSGSETSSQGSARGRTVPLAFRFE